MRELLNNRTHDMLLRLDCAYCIFVFSSFNFYDNTTFLVMQMLTNVDKSLGLKYICKFHKITNELKHHLTYLFYVYSNSVQGRILWG